MDIERALVMLPLWYVVFLLSLTFHEAAHAFAAKKGGDSTAYLSGQVTLNPLPHIQREPIGTIVVPLISFLQIGWMMGWASAPYDPHWEGRYPRRAAGMALAGPLANLVLAAIAFTALRAGLVTGFWTLPAAPGFDQLVAPAVGAPLVDGIGRLFSVMLVLNLVLFVFNLIPFPPMDGASVVAGFVTPVRRLRESLAGSPLASLAGLVIAWFLFPYLFRPLFHWVLTRLYGY